MPTNYSPYVRYRPARQTLTAMETIYTEKLLTYDYEPALDEGEIDFIARAEDKNHPNPLLTRRVGAYFESGLSDIDAESIDVSGFQITYSFPYYRRPNMFINRRTGRARAYGSNMFSYRMLYEFLCLVYNGGDYFIDSYLDGEFKYTPVYERFKHFRKRLLREMAKELKHRKFMYRKNRALREDQIRFSDVGGRYVPESVMTYGDVDKEFMRLSTRWQDFQVWQNQLIKAELDSIGHEMRDQIVVALSTGAIPLREQKNTDSTRKVKETLGFESPNAMFFASGQLIRHLSIYISLDKEAA